MYKLQSRGKTEEARAALAAIPGGKELHMRSIDNAAKAMEDLLLERGGLGSVRRILDQFFDRPIIRTAMSEDLRQRAQPHDQKAIQDMIDSAKAFFTGTMATRGRRTDLDRNVFYAAAAAIIPKKVREDKQVRAVMRLTGLRHDAIIKAQAMGAQGCGQGAHRSCAVICREAEEASGGAGSCCPCAFVLCVCGCCSFVPASGHGACVGVFCLLLLSKRGRI